jgi:hypothetical protein
MKPSSSVLRRTSHSCESNLQSEWRFLMQSTPKSMGPMFVALLLILALASPPPMTAKKKDYLDGKILDAGFASKDKASNMPPISADGGPTSSVQILYTHYNFTVQVEDFVYMGEYKQTGGLIGLTHYKFKEEDWPVNADVEVRFKTQHALGTRHTFMYLRRSNGKEIELTIVSKKGPDGKELCGKFRC